MTLVIRRFCFALHIHHVLWFSLKEAADVLNDAVQKPLTAFPRRPGHVGRDDAVGGGQKGIVRRDGFLGYHVHGRPENPEGTLHDLLARDKARRMTFVAEAPGKGVQEAALSYRVLEYANGMSLVRVRLHTGRTHQIRVQFSSRGMPLVGERKYAVLDDPCEIALWSAKIGFHHPETGEWAEFSKEPPAVFPWTEFGKIIP